MPASDQPRFLVASASTHLIGALEPPLVAAKGRVVVERSAESALGALLHSVTPSLVFLDADLPGLYPWWTQELAQAAKAKRTFPIVLISDNVQPEWIDQLADGAIDDVIPRTVKSPFWRPRLEVILRTFQRTRQFEQLCANGMPNSGSDPAMGILNRPALLSLLFRETDRVLRMNTSLSLVLFSVVDSDGWSSQISRMAYDHILGCVVGRVQHLLRSYDLFGCVGKNEFLLGLPGCHADDAVAFTHRMRHQVFSRPFSLDGRDFLLSGCFAVTPSHGRSPVVVLRNAEDALREAIAAGPGSIECADAFPSFRHQRTAGISKNF